MWTQSEHSRTSIIAAFVIMMVCLLGCSKEATTRSPTEAEIFATRVINERFTEREGRWLAIETAGGLGKGRLIEFNKPSLQFRTQRVSKTDRMNGISDRCTVSVFCEQFRRWDGTWSEWQAGSGGQKQGLVNAMTNGMLGYQYYQLEKKNGTWVIKSGKPPALSTDKNQLQQAILAADGRGR